MKSWSVLHGSHWAEGVSGFDSINLTPNSIFLFFPDIKEGHAHSGLQEMPGKFPVCHGATWSSEIASSFIQMESQWESQNSVTCLIPILNWYSGQSGDRNGEMLLKRRKKKETKDQRPKNQNFQKVGDGMKEEGLTAGGHEHMRSCLRIKRTRELNVGRRAFGRKENAEHRKGGVRRDGCCCWWPHMGFPMGLVTRFPDSLHYLNSHPGGEEKIPESPPPHSPYTPTLSSLTANIPSFPDVG